MIDLRQTKEYADYMQEIGWVVERIDNVNYFIKKFPLIGSFIKIQRPEKINYQSIDSLVVKHRAHRIVIEPKDSSHIQHLISHNYRPSKSPFLPSKTIHVDITKSEKKLLSEMHYKTRYNVKKANSHQLTVISSRDIKSYADFWQKCALKQRGMFLSQKKEIIEIYKAFGEKAHLLLVVRNKELLSGILMLRARDIAYYMYAASSTEGKKLFAPTLNAWETIKLAKKLRCKIFDFEGIFDARFPLKSWLGFSRFKKSFGGLKVDYPGAYAKYRLPF
jgi:hypothetical protein